MSVYVKLALMICGLIFVLGAMFGWNIKPSNEMSLICAFAYCEQTHTQTETVNRTITVGGVTHTDLNGSCKTIDGRDGAFLGDSYVCYPLDEVTP